MIRDRGSISFEALKSEILGLHGVRIVAFDATHSDTSPDDVHIMRVGYDPRRMGPRRIVRYAHALGVSATWTDGGSNEAALRTSQDDDDHDSDEYGDVVPPGNRNDVDLDNDPGGSEDSDEFTDRGDLATRGDDDGHGGVDGGGSDSDEFSDVTSAATNEVATATSKQTTLRSNTSNGSSAVDVQKEHIENEQRKGTGSAPVSPERVVAKIHSLEDHIRELLQRDDPKARRQAYVVHVHSWTYARLQR